MTNRVNSVEAIMPIVADRHGKSSRCWPPLPCVVAGTSLLLSRGPAAQEPLPQVFTPIEGNTQRFTTNQATSRPTKISMSRMAELLTPYREPTSCACFFFSATISSWMDAGTLR
jgi:hypothetical protein